jgi:hypothetical protein
MFMTSFQTDQSKYLSTPNFNKLVIHGEDQFALPQSTNSKIYP